MTDTRAASQIFEDTSISLGAVLDALNTFSENVEDEISGILRLSKDQHVSRIWERYQVLSSVLTLAVFRIADIAHGLDEQAEWFSEAERKALQEANRKQM